MSLDLVILDADGRPNRETPIGMDVHRRLMEAETLNEPLLARLHDYWGDAVFERAELSALMAELEGVMNRVDSDAELSNLLRDMAQIAAAAAAGSRPLEALAE